jgi:PAS domain S-box-containing protein
LRQKFVDRAPAAVPIAALVALTFAIALGAWLVTGHDPEVAATALAVAIPPVIAAAVLLHKQSLRGRGVEARVVGIVESAMDPIVAIDEDQHVILFNAAAERVFRWPRAAVLGQPIDMLLPARFRDGHRDYVRRFADTGVTSRQMGGKTVLTALRANGDEFPIEASISQHVEQDRRILTVILRDITERGRAESLLGRSEARLRAILDSAMDAIITVDDQQKIVLFNAAAERMFHCTHDQAIGAPLAWLIPDRFRERHTDHVRDFGATGVTSRRMGGSRIVTGLRRNGEEFPIDASISQLSEDDRKYYSVILRDVSERVRAHEALARSKDELRELAAAAGKAREQEQSRIARELHDELAQAMSMLKLDVVLIRAAMPPDRNDALARLAKMEQQIDATIKAMRRIASDLRPLSLDDLGVFPAIESLVHDFQQRTGIRCELAIANPTRQLTREQSTAVFRIVQESLTNVTKHAQASRVEVALLDDGSELTVSVRDNGRGFDPAQRPAEGFGLLGVRERAYLVGGTSAIVSAPGEGTEVEVTLPLAAHGQPA